MNLNIAVIGLGTMGQRRIDSLRTFKDVTIVYVCDAIEDRAKITAEKIGCRHTTDYLKIIETKDIGCVFVCLPNKYHKHVVVAALKSGKHVFCEKPLASTIDDAEEIVNRSRQTSTFLKVGSNHRFFPNVVKAREIVENGGIGKPLVFRGWIGHDGSRFGGQWFTKKEIAGGGTLIDNGCHLLDISRWLMGDARDCFATVENLYYIGNDTEDYASVSYTTKRGGIISIDCSWLEWYGYMYYEAYGDKGFIIVDSRYGNKLLHGRRGDDHIITYDYSNLPPQSYRLEMQYFINSVMRGEQPEPSGQDGYQIMRMIFAAYKSAQSGRRVDV